MKYNKPIKNGTAKAWLGSASLQSLAKHYQPLIGALCLGGIFERDYFFHSVDVA